MENKGILVLVYFIAVAIINFVIYTKLSNYMYMAAGVTRDDVRRYLSQQNSSHAQRHLVDWLKTKTENPKEFNTIHFFCSATSFIPAITPVIIFMMIMLKLDFDIVKIIMIVEAVITVLLAICGFSYGRKIKDQTEFDFETAEYRPCEEEYSPYEEDDEVYEVYEDSEDEPYDETYNEIDSYEREAREQKTKKLNYIKKLIVVIVMLILFFSPIIFRNVNFKINNGNDYGQNEELEEKIPDDVDITYFKNQIEEEGFETQNSLENIKKQYPNYHFEDALLVDEYEMYVNYLQMEGEEDAKGLYDDLKAELIDTYTKDKDTDIVTKDKAKNRILYAIENDEGYAIVVRDKDRVIYAHCDKLQTTWLKWFMNGLGYLKTF